MREGDRLETALMPGGHQTSLDTENFVFLTDQLEVSSFKQKRFLNKRGPQKLETSCDTARTQTWNLLIRSQMLYSIKLRCRIASANIG